MQQLAGQLVTPQGIVQGELIFDARIRHLHPTSSAPERYVLPGFIDVHVHGGGGGDAMDGPEGVYRLARFHLAHGTTTLLPTTITNPLERILAALEGIAQVQRAADPALPSIPGAHLEGPFISPARLGAQPPFARPATPEHIAALLDTGAVRLITVAPEVDGVLAALPTLIARGVRLSIGHTAASYAQVRQLIAAARRLGGVVGFTHLWNAMGGVSAREPGAVGAALEDAESYAELILDGHHLHPTSARLTLAAKRGRVLAVSDAIRAAGLADGDSELGGQRVTVRAGVARLADGALAGSTLTLDRALGYAVKLGLTLSEASALLSSVPAAYLGLSDRGALRTGLRADLVVLDAALQVQAVYLAGKLVSGAL